MRVSIGRRGAAASVALALLAGGTAVSVVTAHPVAAAGPTTLFEGQYLHAGQELSSGNGFNFVMQGDGNFVIYQGGTAIWATMTNGNSGAFAVLQGDGNLVVYTGGGHALWASHTNGYGAGLRLVMQTDGNAVIYNSANQWLWTSGTDKGDRGCWGSNSCNQSSFLNKILGQGPEAPAHGVDGPITPANMFALETWNRAEGGPIGCPGANPLNTTQYEPGSYSINSVGVKRYQNASGQSCQYWGIVATSTTLNNGYYGPILNALRNPSNSSYSQCVNLARAVGSTPWGTGDFEADC